MSAFKSYPVMKDSGVPSLGEVPEHWEVHKLRNVLRGVAERNRPDLPLLSVVREKGVILRDVTNRDENHNFIPDDLTNYKVVRKGQFVMNKMKAWQGSYGVSRHDGIVSPAYFIFDIDRVDGAYFHSVIRSKAYVPFFTQASDGVRIGQWDLSQARMKEIPFFIPPLPEQSAIVRFLDYMDRRIRRYIRTKQRLIKLLEEQKQVIIHRAVTRGLDPNVRLKSSDIDCLGDIPVHWDAKRLRHISPEITVGVVVNPSSYFAEDGIPILLGNNVLPGRFKLSGVQRISEESNRILVKSRLKKGDIVVVRVGAPGVAAVVPNELDGCNCASMMIVRQSPTFKSHWLAHLFNSPVIRSQVDIVKYGAAQKQFNISHAVNFWFPFPPLSEQNAIVEFLENELRDVEHAIANEEREITLLREYRVRLIADVVTGKLDAREVTARLPDESEEPEPLDETDALTYADEDAVDDLDAVAEENES